MIKLFSYLQETHGISRREYMQMLKENAVYLNNEVVLSINATFTPGDSIEIRKGKELLLSEIGQELRRKKRMIVLFNKPKGYAVSKEDKHNKTIYDLLPKSRQKDFYYIGRLDKDSHGLLLLTNDTTLVDFYERPENNVYKFYEVQIDKPFKTQHVQKAKKGVLADENGNPIQTEGKKTASQMRGRRESRDNRDHQSRPQSQHGELLKAINIRYQQVKEKHFAIVTLNEGKKRHIRRLFKALGYTVKDLKRVKVGKYQLGTIKPGKYMMQPYKENMREMRDQKKES